MQKAEQSDLDYSCDVQITTEETMIQKDRVSQCHERNKMQRTADQAFNIEVEFM